MFLVRALPWPGAADRSVMSISRQQLQTRGVHSRPHSRTRTVPRVGVLTWAPTGRPSVLVVRTYCCMAIWGVRVRKIESIRLHWHGPVVEQGKTHGAVRAPCRFLCREFRARAHAAIAKKKKLLQFFFWRGKSSCCFCTRTVPNVRHPYLSIAVSRLSFAHA